MMVSSPRNVAKTIRNNLVYQSDNRPFIWPMDQGDIEPVLYNFRWLKYDFPRLRKSCNVLYPNLFPYNAMTLLNELPIEVRLNLGTEDFALQVKEVFSLKCQHAQSHTVRTCTRCVKNTIFNSQPFIRNHKIYEHPDDAYHDGLYFNLKRRNEITWSSLFSHSLYSRKRNTSIVSHYLRNLRQCKSIIWNPAVANYPFSVPFQWWCCSESTTIASLSWH